jgi:CubicO group peptidase (beta-lactamase class C family)
VFERYYNSRGERTAFPVRSVTKSVLSAVAGMVIADVDQPIAPFFPNHDTYGLTVRHLLTLTTGYAYRESGPRSIDDILGETPARPPDEFTYEERAPHLLSAVISQLARESVLDVARERLFKPLGISPTTGWPADSDGVTVGGTGLHLTGRDMARFGLLYASGGAWAGRQLIPPAYFEASTAPQTAGGSPMWMPYGWLWWTPAWHRGHGMLAAGFGGQAIYVNSELDAVIVLASKPAPGASMDDWTVLNRYLIPAITDW